MTPLRRVPVVNSVKFSSQTSAGPAEDSTIQNQGVPQPAPTTQVLRGSRTYSARALGTAPPAHLPKHMRPARPAGPMVQPVWVWSPL
jgi:hypothetical protein